MSALGEVTLAPRGGIVHDNLVLTGASTVTRGQVLGQGGTSWTYSEPVHTSTIYNAGKDL